MKGVNKVILIGRVGTDPELRKMENSRSKLNIRLATTESFKKATGEWQDITDWHSVVMWGPMAERGEKDIKKGNLIYIEGKIRTRSWDDKDGNKRYVTEIISEYYQNLTPKDASKKEQETDQSNEDDVDLTELDDQQLPF